MKEEAVQLITAQGLHWCDSHDTDANGYNTTIHIMTTDKVAICWTKMAVESKSKQSGFNILIPLWKRSFQGDAA